MFLKSHLAGLRGGRVLRGRAANYGDLSEKLCDHFVGWRYAVCRREISVCAEPVETSHTGHPAPVQSLKMGGALPPLSFQNDAQNKLSSIV